MNIRGVAMFGVLALVAGCSQPPPGQYALTAQDAYKRLAQSEIRDFLYDRQCGVLVHAKTESQANRSVTWRITSSGKEMLSFTATLTPVDAKHTKVSIAISKEPNGREAYDGNQNYTRPALSQPTRPAIEELIAALLGSRPYDPARVPRAEKDRVCSVQRAGLEHGLRFSVHDRVGGDAR